MKKGKKTLSEVVKRCVVELNSKSKIKENKKSKKDKMPAEKGFFVSSIIKSMINSSIESSKDKKKLKQKESNNKEYKIIKDERDVTVNGGYGTVSKSNGYVPQVKYVNYGKLFSHLGSFKSKSMYEDFGGQIAGMVEKAAETTREMVSQETMEKAAKHFKYFVRGEILGDFGFVPPMGLGIDSKEWEKYRLMSMMSIYRPLFKLKTTTA